jgi:hypothetical protein
MYLFSALILKYTRVLQKAENQYGLFIHVLRFKASHQDLLDCLNQFQLHVQTRLTKIIRALHQDVSKQSAKGLKGIFKEGYYMIAGEHDAYTVDSIITLSVIQN